jgi:hypothetical protein
LASVLYYGPDKRVKDLLDDFFKRRQQDAGEVNSITHVMDERKYVEALTAVNFDVMMYEQVVMGQQQPQEFVDSFYKKFPNRTAPKILVGTETDHLKVLKILNSGFKDYLLLPPDKALLIEKITMYTIGRRTNDTRQVYSLQLSQNADVAKPGVIEGLSEFDCQLRSTQQYQTDELAILYSKAFGADFSQTGSVIGRCYGSEPHESFEGQFLNSFYFLGITPDILTNIRNALRKTYISQKGK